MIKQPRKKNKLKGKVLTLITFIITSFVSGFIILLPVYLTILFIRKILNSIIGVFKPLIVTINSFIPFDGSITEIVIALIILLLLCFLVGIFFKTSLGLMIKNLIEPKLEKIPVYHLLSTLTRQITGFGSKEEENLKVAFVALGALDEALSIGFLLDHYVDTGYVVFVPSVPTPALGGIYIVPENKVFPSDIPFPNAVRFYLRWGEGSHNVLEALKNIKNIKN